MRIKSIIEEDFVNYKLPSMFISCCFCDWKCCTDGNFDISICQNSQLSKYDIINIDNKTIFKRFINNEITKSIVIGGLEPILQLDEIIDLIYYFRNNGCFSDFVIYTGYNKGEIENQVNKLRKYENIIIKFGRYVPNQKPHMDKVLGVMLASDNQYAEEIK